MPRAALDGVDLGTRHQLERLARLDADLLYPAMAGHVIRDIAQRLLEIGFKQAILVALDQILERIDHGLAHCFDIGVAGEHQWQFLLVHQGAGRYRREDGVALPCQLGQRRDVDLF